MRVNKNICLVKHEIIAPGTTLSSYIRYFWTLEVARKTTVELPVRTFVDDSPGAVIEFSTGRQEFYPRRSMLYGQTTSPTKNTDNPSFLAIGVLFQPWAIKELFGINAHELTNQRIRLDEFLRMPFTEIISSKKTIPDIIKVLSHYLAGMADVSNQDALIRHCIRYIKTGVATITVKELCDCYRLSERQLERRFLSAIGVTPRHYIKTARFKAAIGMMADRSFDKLSDIAYRLNYFDQAHFIRQVKDLSGLTPGLLQSRLHTTVANIIL